jgi:hypothetical protein
MEATARVKPPITKGRAMAIQRCLAPIVAFFLVCVAPAWAVSVFVANSSFEQPVASFGDTSTGTVSQAADTAILDWGVDIRVVMGVAGVEIASNASDGVQTAYIVGKGNDIYQDVGALLPNTTYSLTTSEMCQPDGTGAGGAVFVGMFNGVDDTGTFLGAIQGFPTAVAPADITFTYTTGSFVSGDLTIYLDDAGGIAETFDNVRLTATSVPEPSTLALLGLSALSLLAFSKRLARS